MALIHRDRQLLDWPAIAWPERWRQMLDADGLLGSWLRVEEFEEGNTLVIRAELPDIDPEKDVEVTTSEGMVHIHAHREEKSERKDRKGYRSEFRYGDFDRHIALPEGAAAADVTANYTNGILEVRIPCPVEVATEEVRIPVTHS